MRALASLEIPITEPSQVGHARRAAVQIADACGCSEVARGQVAIVVNELATNLLKHARAGRLILREAVIGEGRGLELISIDNGPGIENLETCLSDGYSSSGTSGTGLGAIRRLSADWDIYSQTGSGTVQIARLGCEPGEAAAGIRISGLSVAAPGESECGDAWLSLRTGSVCRIMVADGLGHGPLAAQAARESTKVFVEHPDAAPSELLQLAHQALRATRGAAVAVAEVDLAANLLRFSGIGNIAAFIVAAGKTQNMVSLNGTLGAHSPTVREFNYNLPQGSLVVFHSDGLSSHMKLDGYRGLLGRDPAVIAGVLYRDFKRGRDDATVVVASVA